MGNPPTNSLQSEILHLRPVTGDKNFLEENSVETGIKLNIFRRGLFQNTPKNWETRHFGPINHTKLFKLFFRRMLFQKCIAAPFISKKSGLRQTFAKFLQKIRNRFVILWGNLSFLVIIIN